MGVFSNIIYVNQTCRRTMLSQVGFVRTDTVELDGRYTNMPLFKNNRIDITRHDVLNHNNTSLCNRTQCYVVGIEIAYVMHTFYITSTYLFIDIIYRAKVYFLNKVYFWPKVEILLNSIA